MNGLAKKSNSIPKEVIVAPVQPIAPKRKYQKKKMAAAAAAAAAAMVAPIVEEKQPIAVKEEAAEKPREVVPVAADGASEPALDARSARKFRAQIKAGDHFLIHSHSLSH